MTMLKSINQEDLRNHNLSVIIDTILRAPRPMSRADLAKATGLTKATLSLLGGMLLEQGVVCELKPEVSLSGYGRPSTPLAVAADRWAGVGLQINTDGYGCLAQDLNGSVIDVRWVDSDMRGANPDDIFDQLDSMVRSLVCQIKRKGITITGYGLALPGLVTDDMYLLMAPNLGWKHLNLGAYQLVRRLDLIAGNEAKMAAMAQIPGYASQYRYSSEPAVAVKGRLSPSDSFMYISTDIGIGGAVVRSGVIETGDRGFAGELGHVSVDLHGPSCRCGRHGCLETYAGRTALVEAAGIASGREAVNAKAVEELFQRWEDGDNQAVCAVNRAVDALVSVMASAINLADIDTVMIGGFWSHFSRDLIKTLEGRLASQIVARDRVSPRVLLPEVADRPALRGAALVGLRQFVDNPLAYFHL
ncbi:ROK family transcriptional regulator [Bombiscardovia coagulans]|uniref:NagC family transcriptional regulator n=1 Tax=Bombiscardovia coagulans TaxID=686666 RepID=A0A261EPP3_9BIFI|nr:ROK family transcriptional regulator [Bombiscardovia coagulans]OZG48656.1 NagC family transcriptional regulator [Bombiscardovia coagulans]